MIMVTETGRNRSPFRTCAWYLLMVSRKRNQNEFAWQNTKKLTTHLILTLMCFLFFQANFILVPFPTHRQQVASLNPPMKTAINIHGADNPICSGINLNICDRCQMYIILNGIWVRGGDLHLLWENVQINII